MKFILKRLLPLIDLFLGPLVFLASALLLLIRKGGVERMRISRAIFRFVGVFPIRDHYYEPFFTPTKLKRPLDQDRNLPGIDFNVREQLELVGKFRYQDELVRFPRKKTTKVEYHYENGGLAAGDAEFYYSFIRHAKPRRIYEVGSGMSTLMAINAVKKNKEEDPGYACEMVCIEPYEHLWLAKLDIKLRRQLVEEVPVSFFKELQAGDILFIDSSHMIRPQGDVLYEFLELLPQLNPGVFVHVHDIFTPRDYLEKFLVSRNYFWNEQYLLEAFLSGNRDYRIVAMMNYLSRHHQDLMAEKFPVFGENRGRSNPGSFWIRRI